MVKKGLIFAFLWTVLLSFSCQKEVVVDLKVQVKNNQGEDLEGARVLVNGKEKGYTGKNGVFMLSSKFKEGAGVQVEIRKESDRYIYAPYFDSFVVKGPEAQNGVNKAQIKAILYFVPKPDMEDLDHMADKEKAPVKAESAKNTEKKVAALKKPENKEKKAITPKKPAAPLEPSKNDIEKALAEAAPKKEPALKIPEKNTIKTKIKVKPKEKPFIINLYAYNKRKPLKNAIITSGLKDQGILNLSCTTNSRGRCLLKLKEKPKSNMTFIARKKGFQTQSKTVRITEKTRLSFNLPKGQSIDIYTNLKKANYVKGLENIQVYIEGRHVGRTNAFGHLSYFHKGKKGDLVEVVLKARGYLPREYATDFIVSGDMTLKKHFTPITPPPVKVALLDTTPAGSLGHPDLISMLSSIHKTLESALDTSFYSKKVFQKAAKSLLHKEVIRSQKTLSNITKVGWSQTPLAPKVDAFLKPVLLVGNHLTIELSIIDSKGNVVSAAKKKLQDADDKISIEETVKSITQKLMASYPFEGAITEKKGDEITINIGQKGGQQLQPGTVLDIYGTKTSERGAKKTYQKISTAMTQEVKDSTAKATIKDTVKRAIVEVGDLVVVRGRQEAQKRAKEDGVIIHVTGDKGREAAVAQANLYLDEKWIGATNAAGRVQVTDIEKGDLLKIVKHGYSDFTKKITFKEKKRRKITVSLRRHHSYIMVDSTPQNAVVKIDRKIIGKTPLKSPVSVPSGFVTIEIIAPKGYKNYKSVLELDEGTLDLQGPRKITLERDFMVSINTLLDKGQLPLALKRLEKVPDSHSDKTLAEYVRGEIYLTLLGEPAKAAQIFGEITQKTAIKTYQDKRFIGAHVNEGLAVYLTAEKLSLEDKDIAIAHFRKAMQIFQNVAPHLRFIGEGQYQEASHKIAYHKALSLHKIYDLTQNTDLLPEVSSLWQQYLDRFQEERQTEFASQRKNAATYLKQARSMLPRAKQKG